MFRAILYSITKMFQSGSLGHLSGKIITSFYINDPVLFRFPVGYCLRIPTNALEKYEI